jgi:DnaJ family protein A protein 2
MTKRNYYEILGISQNSSIQEIKKAYKTLAMKHHPDRGGDPEVFKDINEAYAVLSDASKKEKYDRFGSVDMEGINVNDIFQNIFGGGMPHDIFQNPFFQSFHSPFDSTIKCGEDRHLDLTISLEEVMMGKTILYKLQRKIFKKSSPCQTCNGNGKMIKQMNLGMGIVTQNIMLCSSCKGKGIYYDESVFETEENKIEVVIPPGIPEGTKIIAKHKADSYEGFQNGHVVFTIRYEPHKQFRIADTDHLSVICIVTISLVQFLKGFTLQFTHLDGSVIHLYSTELFADTISKPLLKRIPSLGITHENHRGDLLIEFHVDMTSTPKSLMDYITKEITQDENMHSLYYDHEFNIRKLSWL